MLNKLLINRLKQFTRKMNIIKIMFYPGIDGIIIY